MSEKRAMLQEKARKIRTPFSKDVLIFLAFVVLSFIFWLMYTMSKVTEVELSIPIKYENIPAQYILTEPLLDTIKVKVKDVGFNILMYESKSATLNIDFKDRLIKSGKYIYISSKEIKKKLLNRFSSTMTLVNIEPKIILIRYEELYEKELPIKFNGKVTLSQQYVLNGQIELSPTTVKVYGSKKNLDTMSAIYTKELYISDLNTSVKKFILLEPIKNIRFQFNKVKVFIPVELFTEKTLAIPVMGINFPKNIRLRTFPATINVSFFVGLSHFKNIDSSKIHAYIDYDSLINNKEGKQEIVVSSSIPYISNFKLSHTTVEYILEEK